MVQIYPSVCRMIFGYVIKLIRHNLENTESSTEQSLEFFKSLIIDPKHFQRSSNSKRGIFWPSGTVWNQFSDFQKNSVECSVFSRLCYFRRSVARMILKFTQNNAMAIWKNNCGVESVNGTLEQILWNSVKNSVFSRLCHISLITFPKLLKLWERTLFGPF